MTDFDARYKQAAGFRRVLPELRELLRACEAAVGARDVRAIAASVRALLELLVSPRGRTDANCCVTDYFFAGLEVPEELPDEWRAILADLGGALHDTIYAPHIAANFDSTPEQLLARVRLLSDRMQHGEERDAGDGDP